MEAERVGRNPAGMNAPAGGGDLGRRDFVRVSGALGATLWAAPQLSTIRLAQLTEIGSPPPDTTPGSTGTTSSSSTTTSGSTTTTTSGSTTTTSGETTTTTSGATTTTTGDGPGTTVETLGSTTTTAPTGTTAPGKTIVTTPPNTSSTPTVTQAGGTSPTTNPAAPGGGGPGGGPGGDGDTSTPGLRGLLPFTGGDVRGLALLGAAAVAVGRALTRARTRLPWLALDDDAPSDGGHTTGE